MSYAANDVHNTLPANRLVASRMVRLTSALLLAGSLSALLPSCASVRGQNGQSTLAAEDYTFEKAKALYHKGNYSQAAVILKQLADKGDPAAQYALGYLYYYGQGVEQNTGVALDWFKLSAAKGFSKAIEALQRHEVLQHRNNGQSNRSNAGKSVAAAQTGGGRAVEKGPQSPASASKEIVLPSEPTGAGPASKTRPAQPDAKSGGDNAQQPSDSSPAYAIQLMSTSSRQAAKAFIDKYGLAGKGTVFRHMVNGQAMYSVIYGHYKDPAAATADIAKLPPALRKLSPWVRRVGDTKPALTSR